MFKTKFIIYLFKINKRILKLKNNNYIMDFLINFNKIEKRIL